MYARGSFKASIIFAGSTTFTTNSTNTTNRLPITNCTVQDGGRLNCSQITDSSCDHSMDLGVVCRTYEQLYSELLIQSSSTVPTLITTIITALGAGTGVLVILLFGTVTALVVMCKVLRKRQGQTNTVVM